MPVLTIIIPTYNAEETIKNCLDSLLLQQFFDMEIIIADGLSTDNTLSLIKSPCYEEMNIKIISEKDDGIYDAMNKAITRASGEWLYFLGADDRLFDENVLSGFSKSMAMDLDLIYGNSVWWPENIIEGGPCGYSDLLKRSINHQRIFYRRSLFTRLGNYNTRYRVAADYELNIRFFCDKTVRRRFIDLPVAYYNSGGFTAHKIDEDFWNDWEKILVPNFRSHLPEREIYVRVGWYCWHKLDMKKYPAAALIFYKVFSHSFNMSFLKHTLSQSTKALRVHSLKKKSIF